MKYGIAVNSGTSALQLAVACLDLEPGDEIILPTFTMISSALAVVHNKGVPVLVDADPETWTMDVSQIASRITPRTRAIMAVHIYGHPCDMGAILKLARAHNLAVIEDAAEAHGAEYRGRKCGGLGDLSCFSFYANKLITTGEGGMVLTNRPRYAERVRSLRHLYFGRERHFLHAHLGYNLQLSNVQAAIGLGQLENIDTLIGRKRWMADAYARALRDVPGLILPKEAAWAKSIYWMYAVLVHETTLWDAKRLAQKLRGMGVETRPFFLGMHEQPAFKAMGLFQDQSYPVADRLARQGLYLPSGATLSEDQIGQVTRALKALLKARPQNPRRSLAVTPL